MSLSILDADGGEVAAVQPDWADVIELGSGASISDDALRLALASNTPVNFLTGGGGLLGRAEPPESDRAELHLAQAAHVLDPEKRGSLAGRFVEGRLRSQSGYLLRLNKKRKKKQVAETAELLRRLAGKALIQKDVQTVMGIEGQGAQAYWKALALCARSELGFSKRERSPPPDPLNVVISFLSTRLAGEVGALLIRRGVHPGFSYLHSVQEGRRSLALDLMEEFRAPLAEAPAMAIFNQKVLKAVQFTPQDHGGVRASSEAVRRMVQLQDQWLRSSVTNQRTERRSSWRGMIEEQILAYMRHVQGRDTYRSFLMKP